MDLGTTVYPGNRMVAKAEIELSPNSLLSCLLPPPGNQSVCLLPLPAPCLLPLPLLPLMRYDPLQSGFDENFVRWVCRNLKIAGGGG